MREGMILSGVSWRRIPRTWLTRNRLRNEPRSEGGWETAALGARLRHARALNA